MLFSAISRKVIFSKYQICNSFNTLYKALILIYNLILWKHIYNGYKGFRVFYGFKIFKIHISLNL